MKKILISLCLMGLMVGCNSANAQNSDNSTTQVSSQTKGQSSEIIEVPKLTGPKQKIAIIEFENKSDSGWYRGGSVGRGMQDMAISALVKSNNFIVVDRAMLGKVLEEQKLSQTSLAAPNAAIKLGKLLSANALLVGAVTEFGFSENTNAVGGWVLGQATQGLVNNASLKTYTARAAVDYRLIDTSTGQILSADSASYQKSDTKVDFDSWKLPSFSLGSDSFNTSLIGEVTRNAINNLVAKISGTMENVPWRGYILKADSKEVWVNAGIASGIKAGMKFNVLEAGEDVTDAEGNSYKIPGGEIAQIEIVQPLEKLSKAKIISGSGVKKDMEVVTQ